MYFYTYKFLINIFNKKNPNILHSFIDNPIINGVCEQIKSPIFSVKF